LEASSAPRCPELLQAPLHLPLELIARPTEPAVAIGEERTLLLPKRRGLRARESDQSRPISGVHITVEPHQVDVGTDRLSAEPRPGSWDLAAKNMILSCTAYAATLLARAWVAQGALGAEEQQSYVG
jgi:hypothetical protein